MIAQSPDNPPFQPGQRLKVRPECYAGGFIKSGNGKARITNEDQLIVYEVNFKEKSWWLNFKKRGPKFLAEFFELDEPTPPT